MQTGTILRETSSDIYDFEAGDYNGDNILDLMAIKKNSTGTNSTEVHILNGAVNVGGGSNKTGDTLYGLTGDDLLVGSDRADFLNGGSDNDSLYGGDGNDQLLGGAGNDILYGGLGNDILIGDSGDLSGVEGNDIFVLQINQGLDIIKDFTLGQDNLGLSNGLTFNKLSFNQQGSSTVISSINAKIAILEDINANDLNVNHFVSV
ncbi:hemolysin-type calcium-binding repeat protein [Leptolyngbya sp. PCC 7375]|nr:hemolysin-type calcium-binding repeat protein [Leptolyngbya sp. PCC 7375]